MDTGLQDKAYLKSLSVLYIEDDGETREQFVRFLRRVVGVLLIAQNGREGLNIYRTRHPHIIITDIQMPEMDGMTMINEIRKHDPEVSIIIVTAFEQLDYLKNAINAGVYKYITKPVDSMRLMQALLECSHMLIAEREMKIAASSDPLTGLANRRELNNHYRTEESKSERHGTIFSILMVDIDHFKRTNDTYGHLAGDHILKVVANTIRAQIRLEDICGRWGGEEFLLILPMIDRSAAGKAAEKIRLSLESIETSWEGNSISVTVSVGVSQVIPGLGMDRNIEIVDNALYRAKKHGRNCSIIAAEGRVGQG